MAGIIAVDGGRVLKAAWLGFAGLIWAAPVFAQSADPLSPLPVPPEPAPVAPAIASPPAPMMQQPVAPVPAIVAPKDWRGVFDAIYAGNWASARAGIATLPANVLTPVALAELYTARGSPMVDLGSIQSLIARAPDLPQSEQLAAMAVRRGALTAPAIVPTKRVFNLGSAPGRYRARPVTGDPSADQLRAAL